MTNPGVHIALLNVGGPVSPEDKNFNPPAVSPLHTLIIAIYTVLTLEIDCKEVLGIVFAAGGSVDARLGFIG